MMPNPSALPRAGVKPCLIPQSWSRRRFLQVTTLASAGLPFITAGAETAAVSPNSKLRHACIGVGGMGWGDLQNFVQHKSVEIAALCDVDANALKKAAELAPKARLYADWRELLNKEGDKIDSFNVSVPDHMHFPIACSAVQAGKHVYCQKPMCHDVAEVRALTKAVRQQKTVSQLGTQMASSPHERTAVKWIKEGRIGKIKHAYLCSNRPGAVEAYRLLGPRPATGQPVPDYLSWDLWIGSAPFRPFVPDVYHPVKWRAWQDFGTGWSGDIGCHIFDPMWKGLGLKAPLTVRAEVQETWKHSPARRADTWPQANHITWTFPANDLIAGSELVVEWFDGAFYPPEDIRKLYSPDMNEYPPESTMLVGTDGAMLIGLGIPPQLLPEDKFKGTVTPQWKPRNHYHHFVDACLGGEETESRFEQTGPMTEAILLGTVAIRVPGEPLDWDATAMRVPNNVKATQLLKRTYREGWAPAIG